MAFGWAIGRFRGTNPHVSRRVAAKGNVRLLGAGLSQFWSSPVRLGSRMPCATVPGWKLAGIVS
jgi:hypothetical protein